MAGRAFTIAAAVRLLAIIMLMAICFILATGCEDEIPPPPEDKPVALDEIVIDTAHMATFKADREMNFTNVLFVFQPDPAQPSASAVSLTLARAAPDGSRLIFGAFADATSLDTMKEKGLDFMGGATMDTRSSGVFTPLSAYQPRFATMRIERIEGETVEGTIKGEFYQFRLARPTAKPESLQCELRFKARLLDRAGGAISTEAR